MARTAKNGSELRAIARRAARAQITETAMGLFAANGFEETTVEQIATAVGVSERTVFRYFPTKEDVVVGHLDEMGERLAETLEGRPADEPPWVALRHVMQVHIDELMRDAEAARALAVVLAQAPSLQSALLNKRARWVDALVPNITNRLTGPGRTRELQARAIVSAALVCLNTAVDAWVDEGETKPMAKLLDTVIAGVRA